MKLFKSILAVMMIAVTLSLASCGSDNDGDGPDGDDGKPSNSIKGTWRCDWGDDHNADYTLYHFDVDDYGDGEGAVWDKGNGGMPFEYDYDKSTQTLTVEYSEYSFEELEVTDVRTNSIVIDGDKYYRTELNYDIIILGEWLLHVGVGEGRDDLSRVYFYNDGTYEVKDGIANRSPELSYTFSSLSGKKEGRYYFDGNRIVITGSSDISGRYIIDGLVINGMRLIREENPKEYPYLIGGWYNR